jgi:hypothetical protein
MLQRFNNYQTYTFEQETLLAGAFRKVALEIRRIRATIHEKQGFWLFKTHVYSKETLSNQLYHGKIRKILDNINALAIMWHGHGVLTPDTIKFFHLKHDEIHSELEKLQDEIQGRDPTWWEEVGGVFKAFVNFIRENKPQFAIYLLMEVTSRYPALRPFISLFLFNPKLSSDEVQLLETARESYIDVNVRQVD